MNDDEALDDRILATANLLLDAVSLNDAEGPSETIQELLVRPLWDIPSIEVLHGSDGTLEAIDPTALLVASTRLVTALLHALAHKNGTDLLTEVGSLRTHINGN